MKAIEGLLAELKRAGTQHAALGHMQTRQELYDLLRYSAYEARDKALKERYGREEQD
jgi:methylisocitrate lyase